MIISLGMLFHLKESLGHTCTPFSHRRTGEDPEIPRRIHDNRCLFDSVGRFYQLIKAFVIACDQGQPHSVLPDSSDEDRNSELSAYSLIGICPVGHLFHPAGVFNHSLGFSLLNHHKCCLGTSFVLMSFHCPLIEFLHQCNGFPISPGVSTVHFNSGYFVPCMPVHHGK